MQLKPGAVDGLPADLRLDGAVYYSFVTLSGLGYGDITPVSGGARMLAYIEAIVGQLYLAIMLARLVALHLTQQEPPESE